MAYFKIYQPIPSLTHIVEYYWRSIIPLQESLTQEVHTPLMQGMTFNLNRLTEKMVFGDRTLEMNDYCYLFGQPARHRLSLSNPTGVDILGVKFTTTGIHAITGMEMRYLADDIVPADCIWGKEVEWLCEALYEAPGTLQMLELLERFLCDKLKKKQKRKIHTGLEAAVRYTQHQRVYSLRDLTELTYVSEKTLERYFLAQIGLSPKKYARICRFNAVKDRLDQGLVADWSELVYAFGYYDQSHFIKEFKEFSGKTPGQYADALSDKTIALF